MTDLTMSAMEQDADIARKLHIAENLNLRQRPARSLPTTKSVEGKSHDVFTSTGTKSASIETDMENVVVLDEQPSTQPPKSRTPLPRKRQVQSLLTTNFLTPYGGQSGNGTWKSSENQVQLQESAPLSNKRKASLALQTPQKAAAGKRELENEIQHGLATPESSASPPESAPKQRKIGKKGGRSIKKPLFAQADKPEPYGQPPIWAEKRQQLCETLPYYRAYMSGAYIHEGIVKAFMVDKEVGPMDRFDEEILIARVGGGRAFDDESGQMVQREDQHSSLYSFGFDRARDTHAPVAVIAGQGNSICPSRLPHYYNVLDWFQVTDVWCEKSGMFRCWMARLEKIKLEKKSWWAPIDSPNIDAERDLAAFKASEHVCNICSDTSKTTYSRGWTCLNTACTAFFVFENAADDGKLDYTEEFIKGRALYTGEALQPLVPPLPTCHDEEDLRASEYGVERKYARGIVCPKCNGCSRRIEWDQWTCEHLGCDFTHKAEQKAIPIENILRDPRNAETVDPHFLKDEIRIKQKVIGLYDVYEFVIPGVDGEQVGVIRHFKSCGVINEQPDGPNDLFKMMQSHDFGLRRNAARQKNSKGEMLTSHWAANWGAPYKYGVSVLSKGFDEAPEVIMKALKRLTWAGDMVVTDKLEPFVPFNELLSIGYFEKSLIGYHDDGEKELGPTVATLSLGAQAQMTLRPKAKSGLGRISRNAKGTKPVVLTMVLDHGDLVVMHGSGIQKLYEHAVTPSGTLRFALTCRHVRPEMLPNDAERAAAAAKGALPASAQAYSYDGDLGARPVDHWLSAAETMRLYVEGLRHTRSLSRREACQALAQLVGEMEEEMMEETEQEEREREEAEREEREEKERERLEEEDEDDDHEEGEVDDEYGEEEEEEETMETPEVAGKEMAEDMAGEEMAEDMAGEEEMEEATEGMPEEAAEKAVEEV